jgi:putative glycosyltransferase (TIGR04372 family)
MIPTWKIKTSSGLTVVTPADITNETAFGLLQHEDDPGFELRFIRRYLQPGMLVVDTSTGLGVTALSMAQQLRNIGQIVALNADDLFFRSVELNELSDLVTDQITSRQPDFVRLETNSMDMFELDYSNSLIFFQTDQHSSHIYGTRGFFIYKLIPALDALAPVTTEDLIQGERYFACLPEHAQRLRTSNLIITATSQTSGLASDEWIEQFAKFTYANHFLPAWKSSACDSNYLQAVNLYLAAANDTYTLSQRFALLTSSYVEFVRLWTANQHDFGVVTGFARVLADRGQFAEAAGVIYKFLASRSQEQALPLERPFLVPIHYFENRPINGAFTEWVSAMLLEALLTYATKTLQAAHEQFIPLLEQLCGLPDHTLAMERRLVLCKSRVNQPVDLEKITQLSDEKNSANFQIWRAVLADQSAGRVAANDVNEPDSLILSQIDWINTTRQRVVLRIPCKDCTRPQTISWRCDQEETAISICSHCRTTQSIDRESVINIIKNDYFALLSHAETLAQSEAPTLEDALIKLVGYGYLLEDIAPVRYILLRTERIGHLAINTEIVLQEQEHVFGKRNIIYVFWFRTKISNMFMLQLWSRVMRYSPLGHRLFDICAQNPVFSNMALDASGGNTFNSEGIDRYNVIQRTRPKLFFTREDHLRARQAMITMGIDFTAPYVCFLGRDSRYLNQELPGINWSYHDYRNMPVGDYLLCMKYFAEKGVYCLRMGSIVEGVLDTGDPHIVDYANRYRDEFMDIYLSATCNLFVSCGTGLDSIPLMFRKPVCWINMAPVGTWAAAAMKSICIHKKFWLKSVGRFLSYREQFQSGVAFYGMAQQYEQAGITVINNTPEEILSAVKEAWLRSCGLWVDTDEDLALQSRVIFIFEQYNENSYPINCTIGLEYLKSNMYLLE